MTGAEACALFEGAVRQSTAADIPTDPGVTTEACALFEGAVRQSTAADIPTDPGVTTPETAMRHLSDVLVVLADRGFDIDAAPPAVLVERAIGGVR